MKGYVHIYIKHHNILSKNNLLCYLAGQSLRHQVDSVLAHKGARQILLIYVMHIIYLYIYHDNITMLSSWNDYVDVWKRLLPREIEDDAHGITNIM